MQNNDYQDNFEQKVPTDLPENRESVQKKSKSKKKKHIIIGVAAVLVVALVAALVIWLVFNKDDQDPLDMVYAAFENTVDDVQGDIEEFECGSFEVSLNLATLLETMYGYPGVDGDVSLKLFADNSAGLALVGALGMGGSDVLDAVAVVDDGYVAVLSEVLLGDEAYGITLDTFYESFDNSVFGPNGAYSLGMSAEEIREFLDSLSQSSAQSTAQTEAIYEKQAAVVDSFGAALRESVSENATVEKSDETVTFGNKECKTTAVHVTFNSTGLYQVMYDVLDFLRTDANVRAFLEECAAYAYMSEDYYGEDPVDDFYASLDDALLELEEYKDTFSATEMNTVVTFYINKAEKNLVGIKLALEAEGETVEMEFLAGPTAEDLSAVTFTVNGGGAGVSAAYEVETNDKDTYEASLKIRQSIFTLVSGNIHWDKKGGDFDVSLTIGGETLTLSGKLLEDENKTVFTLGSFSDGYTSYDLGITFTVTQSDEMPVIADYTDLLTLDEEEVSALLDDIVGAVEALIS